MVSCSVLGCKSRSERKIEDITFHAFPIDAELKRQWVLATGKINWQPTKYFRLCSRHFESNLFVRKRTRTELFRNAVPTLYIIEEDITNTEGPKHDDFVTEQPHMSTTDITITNKLPEGSQIGDVVMEQPSTFITTSKPKQIDNLVSSIPADTEISKGTKRKLIFQHCDCAEDTPRKKRLKTDLQKRTIVVEGLRKKLRAVRQKNRRLIKRNRQLTDIITELKIKYLIFQEDADILNTNEPGNKDFLKRFVGLKGKSKKYSPSMRKFALCLHLISPRAYSYVREQFNTCLPHPQTLVSWYRSVDGSPGFTSEALNAIKTKSNESTKKNYVCLSFDEMSIRKAITLDGSECLGLVNIGTNIAGDNIRMATQALVFMVTALNDSWKIPVGY